MRVVARFYLSEVTEYPGTEGGRVKLQAVSRGAQNAEWAAATPAGSIEMTINNPSAFAWFRQILEASREGRVKPEVELRFASVHEDEFDPQRHRFERFERDGHYLDGRCAVCGEDETVHAKKGTG